MQTYYQTLASTIISNMEKRQIEGYYCATSQEAKEKALSFPGENSLVSFGGSMTLAETGTLDALRNMSGIRLLDRATAKTREEAEEIYHQALLADTYFMGCNAITTQGELINIDGTGNRVAALIYGPKQVVLMAGMNKIVPSVEEAVNRVRNAATPPNCIRLNKKTPCASTGVCHDCLSNDCICNQIVITRRNGCPGRIKVILVGETLGY